jgi:hypothetical protein
MTTITAASIPSSASSTLERLACWALLALARVNPDLDVLEPEDSSTRAVQASLIIDDTGAPRLVGRISLQLNSDYATDSTSKLWAKTLEFSQTALPTGFTSN